jgi:glucose-1-phosphate cytidylyltransferase
MFLANYADVLSDLPLDRYTEYFEGQNRIAGFTCVKPSHTFHVVEIASEGSVAAIQPAQARDLWINGGFFALRNEIFDYLGPTSDLIDGAFQELLWRNEVVAYQHRGFWAAMDTFKEHQQLESMWTNGDRPWAVWEGARAEFSRALSASAPESPPGLDRRGVLTVVPGSSRPAARTG